MLGVDLIVSDVTAEEVFAQWNTLCELQGEADASIRQVERQWQRTTDPDTSARLWDQYSDLWKHYQVLSAWVQVFWAAYVFTTSGRESVFLSNHPSGLRLIPGQAMQ